MTQQEFDAQRWTCGMRATYKGQPRRVFTVDFGERLIGLTDFSDNAPEDNVLWVRCENVTITHTPPIGA